MYDFTGFQHINILLADDDDMFRETTAKTLKKLFQNVYTASNGNDALCLYHQIKPQIIMLDIRMGSTNGLQVAKEIRKENSHVPIFIVSSYVETAEILEACELNLVKYLLKPFTFESLLDVLTKCLLVCNKEMILLKTINNSTQYNPQSKNLIKDTIPIALTKNEITVLELLISNQGKIITYENLIHILDDGISKIAVQNLVFRLRKKVGHNSIQNLAKVGYIFA